MTGPFQLLNPSVLIFLWIPLAACALGIIGIMRAKKILTEFYPRAFKVSPDYTPRRVMLLVLISAAMLLTVFAAARPSWSQSETTVSRKGRDVVFVIDVSRSMLAEDLYPNRLARAKLAVIDALSVIEGDRVALVAFAGTAVVKCPLTLDYSFFRQSIEQLSPDAVSVGGSMIGDALRKTLTDVLAGSSGGYRDIILITDGEDHESYPLKAAEMLGDRDVRLIAIGLGDEDTGKRIPVTDENGNKVFLTYKGQEVWSRLDAATLRQMVASTSGGRYLNVSTGAFDMGEIYFSLIKSQEARFIMEETSIEHEEDFQYFLAPAVILMLIFFAGRWLWPGRRRK
ncbi:MAG: VWA domain-containing protein [Spirochaetales bacterium]|nr:VWA domain-containing protein [Spirochaetales bacterium]